MKLDISGLHDSFTKAQEGKRSRHSPADRTDPAAWQFDFLTLSHLRRDVEELLGEIPMAPAEALALDLGCDKSPYAKALAARGYTVRTMDMTPESGADHVGTVELTGLEDESFELVLCTQVIEHCMNPWGGLREVARILKPGGRVILSAPHVWFYHPHPTDHWRFTQEGMVQICRQAGLSPESLLAQGGSLVTFFQIVNFLVYGVLGRAGAPLYLAMNGAGVLADRVAPNSLFSHNFAIRARKPSREA